MWVLKLDERYLNLSHVVSVSRGVGGLEVVTPYEVVPVRAEDEERVLQAMERIAEHTRCRLRLAAGPPEAGAGGV
jgi:hypothetical protein